MTVFGGIVVESYRKTVGGKGLTKITNKPLTEEIILSLGVQSADNIFFRVPFGTEDDRKAIRRAMLRIKGVWSAYVTDGTGGTVPGMLHVIVKAKRGNTLTEDQFLRSVCVIGIEVRRTLLGIVQSEQKRLDRLEAVAQKKFDEEAERLVQDAALAANS